MRKKLRFMILPVVLLVAGCGSSNSSTTPAAGGQSNSSSSVSLSAHNVNGLGTVLVNSQGRTLYTFANDKAHKVTCTGSCSVIWTPLKIAAGQKPSVSGGVKSSLVSTTPDPAGGQVVTYNGWPLYLYQADPMAGTDHGQALDSSGGFWYAMLPSGTQTKKHVKNTNGAKGY